MTSYSYKTIENAVNKLEGAARKVYQKIMFDDKYTGPSSYLAKIFVGLSLGVPVIIHNPQILQPNDIKLLFGLIEQATGFHREWHNAALLVSREYALAESTTKEIYKVAQ